MPPMTAVVPMFTVSAAVLLATVKLPVTLPLCVTVLLPPPSLAEKFPPIVAVSAMVTVSLSSRPL